MQDLGKIEIQALLIGVAISSMGVIDIINRWKNGKAYRELRKLKNKNQMTIKILKECEPLLKPQWWHWVLVTTFTLCLGRLIIDSY
jgi:hypothetical protein